MTNRYHYPLNPPVAAPEAGTDKVSAKSNMMSQLRKAKMARMSANGVSPLNMLRAPDGGTYASSGAMGTDGNPVANGYHGGKGTDGAQFRDWLLRQRQGNAPVGGVLNQQPSDIPAVGNAYGVQPPMSIGQMMAQNALGAPLSTVAAPTTQLPVSAPASAVPATPAVPAAPFVPPAVPATPAKPTYGYEKYMQHGDNWGNRANNPGNRGLIQTPVTPVTPAPVASQNNTRAGVSGYGGQPTATWGNRANNPGNRGLIQTAPVQTAPAAPAAAIAAPTKAPNAAAPFVPPVVHG